MVTFDGNHLTWGQSHAPVTREGQHMQSVTFGDLKAALFGNRRSYGFEECCQETNNDRLKVEKRGEILVRYFNRFFFSFFLFT